MLIALMAVILFLVLRGAKKTASMQDYALGSFVFSPAAVGLALAASMTSAATFIINPGLIGLYGVSGVISYALVLPLAAFVSLIVLTKRFRDHGTRIKALTMAQWIGNRYQNKGYATFFAILSSLLITFIVLIVVGLAQLLAQPLQMDPITVMMLIVAFVFTYMMFGGANSMVYTNTVQAILMLIVAVILLASGSHFFSDGVPAFFQKLADINPLLTEPVNPESFLFRDYFEIIVCQLVIGVAIVCQPHIITKSLILTKDSEVNRYLTVAISTMVVFFLVVIVGLYARLTFPGLSLNGVAIRPDQLVPTYIVERFQVGVGLVVTLGLIAAGISTLEGLIQSLSVTFTQDLLVSNSPRLQALPEKRRVQLNRLIIGLLALITIALSTKQILAPDLSVAIFAQNGVYAFFSAAFFPLVMGMFTKKIHSRAAIVSTVTSLVVHFSVYYGNIGSYMQNPVNNPAIAATFAILSSVVAGLLVITLSGKKVATLESKTLVI